MASSMSSSPSSHAAPEAAPGGPPCQALFHYHACGCRTTRLVFVCRAPRCAHGGPVSVLVAPLPFACQSSRRAWKRHKSGRSGRGAACAAADPTSRSFRREEDTAYPVPAGDLVQLKACDGLDVGTLDAIVPRLVAEHQDWRAVVAERYGRLRPASRNPSLPRWVGTPEPTADLHVDAAPVRAEPGKNGAAPPAWTPPLPSSPREAPGPGAWPAPTGPNELAADAASPSSRAPNHRLAFATYQGAQLGNAESVLAWLAAHEPTAESPLQSLLPDSEPLPRRVASFSHYRSAPDDRFRRTPRAPAARVDESFECSLGAKDLGSEGLPQLQKSLFGRAIITYFTGGLL